MNFPFLGLEPLITLYVVFFRRATHCWPQIDARQRRTGFKVLYSGLQYQELGSCRSLFQNEGRRFYGGIAPFAPGICFSKYPTKNKSVLGIGAIDYCKVE